MLTFGTAADRRTRHSQGKCRRGSFCAGSAWPAPAYQRTCGWSVRITLSDSKAAVASAFATSTHPPFSRRARTLLTPQWATKSRAALGPCSSCRRFECCTCPRHPDKTIRKHKACGRSRSAEDRVRFRAIYTHTWCPQCQYGFR
jgi:hypothetical protein